jgi:hypothetical protein
MSRRTPSRSRAPVKIARPPVTLGSKVRYPLSEAGILLGVYMRIREGSVQTVTDGRRRFVTDAEVRRYGEQSR